MIYDRSKTITILGCGGFIGSHLLDRILAATEYRVYGIDLSSIKIKRHLSNERFTYVNMSVYDNAGVHQYLEESGIILSLVALCNPSLYNTIPLDVIESNFTRPVELVRTCSELDAWLIHFSTCEVYGKTIAGIAGTSASEHYLLSEDRSPMVLGPTAAQRWCYACAKQLLERVIYAYGLSTGLRYTIVRPFNFIGPRMDYIPGIDGEGVPRVLACFMESLLFDKVMKLVDSGTNRRCFTFIDDAVDAIMRILGRPKHAMGHIFNIGNPDNEITIAGLAELMVRLYRELRPEHANRTFQIMEVDSKEFYGDGYEDSDRRVPDITKARKLLDWAPSTSLVDTLRATMNAYIAEYGNHPPPASCRVESQSAVPRSSSQSKAG